MNVGLHEQHREYSMHIHIGSHDACLLVFAFPRDGMSLPVWALQT